MKSLIACQENSLNLYFSSAAFVTVLAALTLILVKYAAIDCTLRSNICAEKGISFYQIPMENRKLLPQQSIHNLPRAPPFL